MLVNDLLQIGHSVEFWKIRTPDRYRTFFSKILPNSPHTVFARDHQRRLRLVIDLLELEAGRPGPLPLLPMARSSAMPLLLLGEHPHSDL